ncbi:MAG: hypothetical protein ACYS26_09940 [Planctomycetota bacterium]|jgi:hypothetical protein
MEPSSATPHSPGPTGSDDRAARPLALAARAALGLSVVAALAGTAAYATAREWLSEDAAWYPLLPFLCLAAIFAAPLALWVWVAGAGLARRLERDAPASPARLQLRRARRVALLAVPLAALGGWGLLQLYGDSGWGGFGATPPGFGSGATPAPEQP